jgi:2-alkenal reductase
MMVLLLTTAFGVGGLLGGIAGGGLVLWATGAPAAWLRPTPEATATPTPEPTASPTPTDTPVSSPTPAPPTPTPSISEGVRRVLPAVVTIVNRQAAAEPLANGTDTRIRGSGTIIDARGYVATNYHVVQGAGQLTVILDSGLELPARLVALDSNSDIALVRVDNGDLPNAEWGDSDAVQLGEWAIAIGSALGDFPNSVTVGVISGIDRSLELDGNVTINGLIQTDAAINKGNSGGPLVNQRGEVIGINTFIIRENRRVGVAEGIGFAIPSSLARRVLEQWIAADVP